MRTLYPPRASPKHDTPRLLVARHSSLHDPPTLVFPCVGHGQECRPKSLRTIRLRNFAPWVLGRVDGA